MVRLNDLMRDGDILTDEKVDMGGWNLGHGGSLPDVVEDVKGYLQQAGFVTFPTASSAYI